MPELPDDDRTLDMMFLRAVLSLLLRGPSLAGRALIRTYQYTLSALVGHHCRHLPSCSHFGDEALARYGLWAGGWMTLARLCRCHPWGTSGIDNVPQRLPAAARWYLPWHYGRWSWKPLDPTPDATSACGHCKH
ncbi:membrane protein [Afipia sp. P52-10]|nr:membrane protein [Afipia sp. P52-10]